MAEKWQKQKKAPKQTIGFTIVELLIVIVVIAILAAVTIVAINGLQQRAVKSSLSSSLSSKIKQLGVDKATRGSFATSLASLQNSTESGNSGVDYQYTSDGVTFCISATLKGTAMSTSSSNTQITDGVCTGHDAPVTGPITDPVVYTQPGSFNYRQTGGNGVDFSIDISYAMQPTDYVFILFNTHYYTGMTLRNGATSIPRIYSMNMGASGYQWHQAFGVSGLSGPSTIAANACWTPQCTYNGIDVTGGYVIYVMRGLGASPTVATTTTPYGVQPALNEMVAPAAQSLPARKVAIFSNVYYGNTNPTAGDLSSPGLSWITDSTAPPLHLGTAIAAWHTYTTATTSVQFQNTMPSSGTRYTGTVLFTFK